MRIDLNIALLICLSVSSKFFSQYSYPLAKKLEVKDTYSGTEVKDPYRWLEDDRSKLTEEWVKEENKFTQKILAEIDYREKIKYRLTELWNFSKESAPYKKGNYFFCSKNNGLQNQNVLYKKRALEEEGMVLLDPNKLSEDGTVSLSGNAVSKNGKYLAYGISKAGSDWVEIKFREMETGADLKETLRWVKFSGISWKGNGIYYSRYDEPTGSALSEKNQFHKVYYHSIGTDQSKDELIYEDKQHPAYNFSADVSDDENFLYIYVSQSTSGHKLMIKDLREPASEFVNIEPGFEWECNIIDNVGEMFYMRSNHSAPNYKVVSFSLTKPAYSDWITILPETNDLLEGARFCNERLLVNYLKNVTSHLYCFSLQGQLEREIPLPGLCRLSAFNSDRKYDFATYSIVQFIAPEQNYYLDATTWESKLIFKPTIAFDSDRYVTEQVFFNSKDGTRIPMFITHKKGLVMNENTPAFVFGYGGFNISYAPEYRIDRAVFLEAGGIYCVPNIRGGGEYGEEWHRSGTKCKKQNVFDDFIAACEFLAKNKYTSFSKIAIHGRSNGGLLIGAVMTQRPDICRVAIPTVGVLDMLRFHLFTIGRAWTVDYGCSDNKEEFNCLLNYSPLHNIKEIKYPATLILTGDHDDRVVPAHSFKFAATLQEKNKSKEPMLIRIDVNAGHGAGKPTAKQIDEFADMWSFVFDKLGIHI